LDEFLAATHKLMDEGERAELANFRVIDREPEAAQWALRIG
jgi:hypothetical protein